MKNIGLTIILCFITFLIGIIFGHKEEAKKDIYPNYDLTELTAKIDSLNYQKDTTINHFETIIKNEKTIINNNFDAIDSLSNDSAFKLWTIEARQYKPVFN